MMSSCWHDVLVWHFSFSIFSQYLSVQSMEFGWDLGLDGARAFLLFFLFLFWDTWVTCLGIGTIGFSWASCLFFFFSFGALVGSHKRWNAFWVREWMGQLS